MFRSFCPVGNAQALSACTSFTEDDKVFAVVGVFIDQSGDAQLCIAKNHKTVEIIHNVSQSWIDQAPKGLLLTPNITTDRRLNVILDLLAQRKTLKGKKVAVLTQADSKDRVEQLVDPALKKMKVAAGDHGGADHHRHRHRARRSRNSTASSNAGRVRRSTRSSSPGRSSCRRPTCRSSRTRSRRRRSSPTRRRRRCRAVRTRSSAKLDPNPYQGLISVEGQSEQARFETPVMQKCVKTYEKATGDTVTAPKDVKPGSDGKRVEIYASIEDACGELLFFKTIAEKAGKQLNNKTWAAAVANMGAIDDQLVLGQVGVAAHGQVRRQRHLRAGRIRREDRKHRRLEGADTGRERLGNVGGDRGGARRVRRGDRARLARLDAGVAACDRSRPRARPTCCTSCSTTSASRSSGATAPIIDTPNIDALAARGRAARQLPHRRAVLADALVPAHRPQPPHATAWAASPTSRWATPATAGEIPPRERVPLRDPARRRATPRYAVGKWHLTPDDETHMAADRSSWPLGRGFDRWYGFHGGETHQFVPTLYCDNHSVQPPRTVAEGYHLTEDLVDHAIEYLSDLRNVDGEQPFFLYFCTGACHSPHHAPPEWIERYRGRVRRRMGRVARARARTPDRAGIVPAGHRAVAAPAVGAGVGRPASPRTRRSRRGSWSASPGSSRTPTTRSAGCSRTSRRAATPTTRSSCSCPTTAPAPRAARRARSTTSGSINRDPAGREEMRARIDELGGPSLHNNYPWGWTMAGNTPFKRWKREVHEGGVADPCIVRWPARFAGDAGADPPPVRARDRRAAHRPRADRRRGARATIRRPGAEPDRRHELRLPVRRRRRHRAGSARSPSTSRCSAPRALYHDGWKAVTFKPLGPQRGPGPNTLRRPRSTTTCGSSTTSPRIRRRCTTCAADEPERLARMVDLWWEEAARYHVLPLDNRILLHDPQPPPAAACCNARRYRYRAARRAGARERGGRRTQPLARDHRVGRRARRASRRAACCSRSAACSAGGRCTCSTVGCATCTTSTASRST